MKLIDITTSVIVIDKIQAISLTNDFKSINVLMDSGFTNTYEFKTQQECKQNYDAMVRLLREHLEGGDKK